MIKRNSIFRILVPAVIMLAVGIFLLLRWNEEPSVGMPASTTSPAAHDVDPSTTRREELQIQPSTRIEGTDSATNPIGAEERRVYPYYLTGEQSLHDTPAELYFRHIDLAESGDPASMYWVSKSLNECSRTPRDEDDLYEVLQRNLLANPMVDSLEDEYRRIIARCEPLFDALSIDSYSDDAHEWLGRAASAGFSTAGVELILTAPPPMDPATRTMLQSAVANEDYPAWYAAANYILRKRSDEGDTTDRNLLLQKEAWRYAACSVHQECTESVSYEILQYRYASWEVDEILAAAHGIQSGNYPELP